MRSLSQLILTRDPFPFDLASAIQLARLSGFSKIITTSSSSHVDHLKALGATDVVDRSSTTDDFLKIAGNLPLNAVYDAIGSEETLKQGTSILEQRHKGTDHVSHYVTVIPPRDEFENNVTRKVSSRRRRAEA